MHHANLPMEMHYRLFGEIFTTVTMLDAGQFDNYGS